MRSTYRSPLNGHKRKQEISNRKHGLERPQVTSNDLRRPLLISTESSSVFEMVKPNTSKENKLKRGGKIETNDNHLDEILHNNNLCMELAIQIISNDQSVRSNTVQDKKDFNTQSLSTQANEENK